MQAALRPECGQLRLIARCNSWGRRPAHQSRRPALRGRRPACSLHAGKVRRENDAVNEHVHSRRRFQGVFFYL